MTRAPTAQPPPGPPERGGTDTPSGPPGADGPDGAAIGPTGSALAERFAAVRERIAAAAARGGRAGADVLLVAVSKEVTPARVADAVAAGQTHFGENRAQELAHKIAELGDGISWHFLGRLQRNKVPGVVGAVTLLHSVDRLELAEAVARRARALGVVQRVLVQVNVGHDPAKAGVDPVEAPRLVAQLHELDGLRCEGLMTVPPADRDPQPAFAALRTIGSSLHDRFPEMVHLSMGMSGDFEAAVEEGATIVRLGQALFGPRPPARAERRT